MNGTKTESPWTQKTTSKKSLALHETSSTLFKTMWTALEKNGPSKFSFLTLSLFLFLALKRDGRGGYGTSMEQPRAGQVTWSAQPSVIFSVK